MLRQAFMHLRGAIVREGGEGRGGKKSNGMDEFLLMSV